MIPRTNVPRLREEPPNYAIVDLNGEYSAIRSSWRNCMKDFRHWCYNNSQNRYDYGGTDRRSCEAPGYGHFCIYTTYDEKWMCSVVDGGTLYMLGHITRSVGEELRSCENKQLDGTTHLIEGSEYMEWNGSYFKEPLPVGAGALISSFSPLYKCAEGEHIPLKILRKAGQVFFLHFPEAGRFDSLCLDIIDKDFVAGGTVQVTDIERHQKWSADCKVIRAEIGNPAPQTDEEIEKRAKVKLMIKDIRVMHKLGVRDSAFQLQNMPFQLNENGRIQNPVEIAEGGGEGGGGEGGGGGHGGRGGRQRGQGRGRRRAPPGQNAQQNVDDTNPNFLIERFGNFAKITKFHLEVPKTVNNQLYDLVLTSNAVRVFRSSLLQKDCRIRNTPTQLDTENQKLVETLQMEIQAAFRTEEPLQAPPTPHDEMHAGMSHFHACVPKLLNWVDTAPNRTVIQKQVPCSQLLHLPYLMGGDHNGNQRVTPKVTGDVCLLAAMLDANWCSTKIEDGMFKIQGAFRTEEPLQAPPTPHDEMHAGMSHFHACVPKFLNWVDTAPNRTVIKKQVPCSQLIHLPYLMGGDHNGNQRVTPKVTGGVCLLDAMLDANWCSTKIEDMMFKKLCMWRYDDELSAKVDQHHSTRKDMANHFIELRDQLPRSEPFQWKDDMPGTLSVHHVNGRTPGALSCEMKLNTKGSTVCPRAPSF